MAQQLAVLEELRDCAFHGRIAASIAGGTQGHQSVEHWRWRDYEAGSDSRRQCLLDEVLAVRRDGASELSDKCATSWASANQSFCSQLIVTGDHGIAVYAELFGQQAGARQRIAGH